MKNIIINILKSLFPSCLFELRRGANRLLAQNPSLSKLEVMKHARFVLSKSGISSVDDYARQFTKIVEKIIIQKDCYYVYPYDTLLYRGHSHVLICSITVDFDKVLKTDFRMLRSRISECKDAAFRNCELSIINNIECFAARIHRELLLTDTKRSKELKDFFPTLIYRKPQGLDEALQKILFIHGLFWQMGHFHIGLGRLDLILEEYYNHDIQHGILTDKEARELLRKFILVLGKDTVAKSMELIGDTGQYILLGGLGRDGRNVDNALTEIFLQLMTELKIPDPKLILRVNNNTPDFVWRQSILCMMTGIGSPLIMNEEPIMDNMIKFGYKASDVWNVGTSACWEPLIIGKSFDQNNPFRSVVALRPLNKLIIEGKEYASFDILLEKYKLGYKKEIESVVKDIAFDCSPLFTLFFDDCLKSEKDFAYGGAVYAHHGAQVVSLPNTVNALLNIKRLVFDEKKYTLADCRKAIKSNYNGMEDLHILLITTGKKFGSNDDEVVNLTNNLIHYTGEVVSSLMCNGQFIKVGFSSPNYMGESKQEMASLDGRKYGEPFAVHISPVSSKIDISEILDFSSRLTYNDNCINGNVVDFILPSSYIKQPDKLIGILKNACNNGIFELQLNVMDKATLIDAKAHPEKYPNLIVRVWGFSAYFNDLPEEFKDNLIRRAELYEAA